MREHLTLAEALAIHADQIERYGGSLGVRDQGLVEAALARPQNGYHDDLVGEAAALWESLAQNHPFVDGNKRTAFAVTWTFLALNGGRLAADADRTFAFIMRMYDARSFDFRHLHAWLREHVAIDRRGWP